MNFKKDLLKVFSANFINLLAAIVVGFIVPAFLSLDQYATFKIFTLYLTYIGILHFGFIDGLYIKYGGKNEKDVDIGILKGEHLFLLLFQFLVMLVTIIIGYLLNDMVLLAFALAIIPINIQTLFKFLYQALGEFQKYSKIILATPTLLLIINIINIYLVKIDNYWPFVFGNLLTYFIVFIGLEIFILKRFKGVSPSINLNSIFTTFRVGFFIMMGNLLTLFLYALDRWFVKFTLTIEDFAFYSFAFSMMSVVNLLIASVTMVFYPYLARGQEIENLIKVKVYLIIIGVLSSGSYFIFAFIINTFLQKYTPSLEIISVMFVGFPVLIIINALYINLYKAQKLEKKYFYTVSVMCVISFVLNIIAIVIYKSNLTLAIATTTAFYIWFIYSSYHFPILKLNKKEILFLLFYITIYFISIIYIPILFGMFFYFIVIITLSYMFYKKEIIFLKKEIIGRSRDISS